MISPQSVTQGEGKDKDKVGQSNWGGVARVREGQFNIKWKNTKMPSSRISNHF